MAASYNTTPHRPSCFYFHYYYCSNTPASLSLIALPQCFFLCAPNELYARAATVCKCYKCGRGTDTEDNRLRNRESREIEQERETEKDITPETALKLFHMQIGKQTRLCFD